MPCPLGPGAQLGRYGGPCVTWLLLPTRRVTWCHSPPHHQSQRCSLQPFSPRHKFRTQPHFPAPKQTNSTHPGKPILVLPLRAAHAAESRDPNPGREEEQLLLASHLPAGSRACRMVDVAIPALPCIKELPRAPFLPSPLLSPCPPPALPVRSAAAPARAPNALTTAVGLIIKITF